MITLDVDAPDMVALLMYSLHVAFTQAAYAPEVMHLVERYGLSLELHQQVLVAERIEYSLSEFMPLERWADGQRVRRPPVPNADEWRALATKLRKARP